MDILSEDLNSINLDDTNYDEDDPKAIIHVRLLSWDIKVGKRKAVKRELNEEIMLAVWYTRRWWNICISEDEIKQIQPTFT